MGGLLRVPAAGGTPEAALPPGAVSDVTVCSAPHVLPGSRALLFAGLSTDGESRLLAAAAGGGPRVVAADAVAATYAPTGHLVIARAARPPGGRPGPRTTTLLAAPFDARRLELTGAPVPVVPGAGSSAWAADGTLLYAPNQAGGLWESRRTLVWIDRNGREERLPVPPRAYGEPRISPDGGRVALDVTGDDGATDVFVHDLARGASNRLTFDGSSFNPRWSPDGRGVVFTAADDDGFGLFRKAANGAGQTERLTAGRPVMQVASDWVAGPDALVVMRAAGMTSADVHLLPLDGGGASQPLIATDAVEMLARVSPDRRWIAYQSNESGRWAVYVRPFPNVDDGKWQVSQGGGGYAPVWSADGRELFYVAAGRGGRTMMAVGYAGDPTFTPSRPEPLFALPGGVESGGPFRPWDAAPEGGRFLMVRETEEDPSNDPRQGPAALVYVGNWFAELAEQAPIP